MTYIDNSLDGIRHPKELEMKCNLDPAGRREHDEVTDLETGQSSCRTCGQRIQLCWMPIDVHVHGTYVWDIGHDRLRIIDRNMRNWHVAELLKLPKVLHGHDYMWLNKGWIVEERPYKIRNTQIGEGIVPSWPVTLEIGQHIIYLADGSYYRLEVLK